MRLLPIAIIAALAASSLAPAAVHAAAPPAGQPVRKRICHPCTLPAFGVAAPRHGVLLARGGVYGAGTTYLLFDLDRHTLERGFLPHDAGESAPSVPMRMTVSITPDETASLVGLMDRIWAEPQALPGSGASDVFWEAWFTDGPAMRRERGPGNPAGLAEALEKRMFDILSPYEPAAHTTR